MSQGYLGTSQLTIIWGFNKKQPQEIARVDFMGRRYVFLYSLHIILVQLYISGPYGKIISTFLFVK